MNWETLLSASFIVGLLASSVRLATPLLLAALGETFAERAGVLNIGVEGLMIVGALAGFLAGHFSGNPWIGALAGCLAGILLSCVHAYLSAILGADQVVSGLAINLLALGLAVFAFRAAFGIPASDPRAPTFESVPIPLLSQIPFVGEILFNQHAWVYLSWLLVPISYLVLYKTAWGLKVTAVGENPIAAEAAGVSVWSTRFLAVLIGGALGGLSGMTLSLAQLGFFKEVMVAGRGFIAIAICMLGRWNPVGVLVAALLFGTADSLQLRLQTVGMDRYLPPQFLVSLPYLLTVLALLGRAGRKVIPSALAIPYKGSEER
jgi:general nucleoside transport system permease protein